MEKNYALTVEELDNRVRVSIVDEVEKLVCVGSGDVVTEAFQEAFQLLGTGIK
jgi:hypothetical protein